MDVPVVTAAGLKGDTSLFQSLWLQACHQDFLDVLFGERNVGVLQPLVHGEGLAIITPRWMKHILSERTLPRFVKYGINVFGIDANLDKWEIARKAIDETYKFIESIGIPMHLREVGIDDSRLDEMAHHIAVNEGLENAYVPLSEQDIQEILVASL